MTRHEEVSKILKDYLDRLIKNLEEGEPAYVKGGYLEHDDEASVIDANCSKIVTKLISLGYEYTTNHGYGCKDYTFLKPIEL